MCKFGSWHYGKHSCEIILNLDQWFRRLKGFFFDNSILALVANVFTVQQSGTVCALLVDGIMNISVALF